VSFSSQVTTNGSPIDSALNSKSSSCPDKHKKALGSGPIPYVKVTSGKFKHIGNCYNIRTTSKIKHTAVPWVIKGYDFILLGGEVVPNL
jgi:hypothetical protein